MKTIYDNLSGLNIENLELAEFDIEQALEEYDQFVNQEVRELAEKKRQKKELEKDRKKFKTAIDESIAYSLELRRILFKAREDITKLKEKHHLT